MAPVAIIEFVSGERRPRGRIARHRLNPADQRSGPEVTTRGAAGGTAGAAADQLRKDWFLLAPKALYLPLTGLARMCQHRFYSSPHPASDR